MNVREEVERLLAEMRAKVDTFEDLRRTVEISAYARNMIVPEIEPVLIPAYARATLLGAWVQYDVNHRGLNEGDPTSLD